MAGTAGTTLALGACSSPPVNVGAEPPPAAGGAPAAGSTTTGPRPNAPEVNPAGDIPDNQAFVPYRPPGAGFTVRVPEGWARTVAGPATTFTDKFNSVSMSVEPRPVAPTVASEQAAGGAARVSVVSRTAGQAILVGYPGESPPDPVTGKTVRTAVERYEFWRNGRLAVLTLTAPQGADNVDPWRTVTDSFAWTA